MNAGRDEGQAATELALVLPVVALLLLTTVQVALVCRDQILTVHAAREAAREAAVDRTPQNVRDAALRAGDLKPERLRAETSAQGGSPGIVRVVVTYRSPTDVPLVGPLLPDVTVQAKAAMRAETGHAPWKSHHGPRESAGTAS